MRDEQRLREQINAGHNPFMQRSYLGLALLFFLLVPPFALNNLLQGRWMLGTLSWAVLLAIGWNAWQVLVHGRYSVWSTLLLLAPTVAVFLSVSLQQQGVIAVFWCYLCVIAFYFILPERLAWIANGGILAVLLPQFVLELSLPISLRVVMTLLMVSALVAIFVRVINSQQRQLAHLAELDSLTGALQRSLLNAALQRSLAADTPAALVLFGVDRFREFNERHGHDRGDELLVAIAGQLRRAAPPQAQLYRHGSGSFLLLLPATAERAASESAADLLQGLVGGELLPGVQVRLSAAATQAQQGDDHERWLSRVESLLQQARLGGGGRLVTG